MNVYDRFWSFAITISSWSIGRIQWLVAKPRNNLRRTSMQTVSTLHWATEWRTLTWEQQSLHFLCTWIWVQRCWFCGMADSLSAIQRVRLWALVPWSLSNCTGKLGFAQVIFVSPRFVSVFFSLRCFLFIRCTLPLSVGVVPPIFIIFGSSLFESNHTGWCPSVISWFINPINYSYICHKP